jgi:predicted DNA binding CopG/RHH family protein
MLSEPESRQKIYKETPMKNVVLNREESTIERNFKNYRPVSKETEIHIKKIIESSRKSRPISLRINKNDLERLKEKADENGLPYQTMINVVIHKFVTNSYLDKEEITKFLMLKKAS